MADREIRLYGSFKDDISPQLNKLNRQLLGTLKQFEKLQQKIAPVAAEMAKFNTAAAATSGNLKSQRSAIEENIRMLRQYRVELSRTATAQSRMGSIRPPRGPLGGGSGGGGYGGPPPRTSAGGGGGIGAGVFGVTLGNQLSGIISNAVISGFQVGVRLMYAPFQYGAQALGERIRDEMQDIRTAGGLFSISEVAKQTGKGGLFGSFYEAEKYTKEQNRYLAKLAGSLPGDTQEYINVARQIADGIFRIVTNDEKNAIQTARMLAAQRGASAVEMRAFGAGGTTARAAAGKELVGEMTKLTVLAGMGGRKGAYGLPMLIERMMSEQQVSMGMFQRYAAIFGDPMIKNALERNLDKINATSKDTNARFLALNNTLREIVTDDLVERMRRSVSGTIEAMRTAFLNPEVGLLGLGRPIMRTVKVFDKFGQVMRDASGQIETDQIAIFDYLRDIFSGIVIPLQPIIDRLPEIFEPFAKLAEALDTLREEAMFFLQTFNQYKGGLENFAKTFPFLTDELREIYRGTIPFRAGLAALNNALRRLGAYDEKEFTKIAKELKDPAKSVEALGGVLRKMIESFLGSDAARKIGFAVGIVLGIVISQVGEMMKAAAGLATASKLAQGFGEGFRKAGGPEGISNIIRSVFALFGKLLLEIIKAAPLESAIAAALFFLPGAIAGLVGEALSGGFARALSKVPVGKPTLPSKMPGPRAPMTPGPKGGGYFKAVDDIALAGRNIGAGIRSAGNEFITALRGIKPGIVNIFKGVISAIRYGIQEIKVAFSLFRMGLLTPGNLLKGLLTPLKGIGQGVKGFGSLLTKGAKGLGKFGGALTAVVAVFDFVSALLSGKDVWESMGQAAGPVIGTVLGAAIAGPFGAAIGSFIGGLKPVTDFFTGIFKGIGAAIGPIWDALTIAIDAIVGSFGSLFNIVGGVIGSLFGFTGELDLLNTVFIATKVALSPLVWLFNGVAAALLLFKMGLIQVDKFINNTFQGANRAGRIAAEEQKTRDQLAKIEANNKKWNDNLLKPIDRTGAALNNLSGTAATAANNITAYQKKTRELISQGKVSSAAGPSQADKDWYRRMTGKDLPAGAGTTPAPAPAAPAVPSPAGINLLPSIQALNIKQAETNSHLAQINAKTAPKQEINPIPQLTQLNAKLNGALAYIKQLKPQMVASANVIKGQIGASSNAQQVKIQSVTAAVNNLSAKFQGGMPVKVINQPTVKFAMGGMGPIGGGIGKFPKTSGYGMRWGRMHAGNDYAMPVGTKLAIGGPGRILFAGAAGGYGNMVDIGGPDGMVYRFAHLSKFLAPVGATLPPGMPFALSGNTGRSTGPHLHFEARPGGAGPVPPDAFANIIRANFVGSPFGPLMSAMEMEMAKMPYGSQLAVSNSDEIFMKPKQMASVMESATRAGAEGVGNITTGPITISIDGYNQDPKQLTETIAAELIGAMYRKSRSEVLTS